MLNVTCTFMAHKRAIFGTTKKERRVETCKILDKSLDL